MPKLYFTWSTWWW